MKNSDVPNWKDAVPFDGPYVPTSVPKRSGRVRTMFNYDPNEFPGETFTLPSNTVPTASLTVRQIVQRFTRGLEVRGSRFTEMPFDEVDGVMSESAFKADPTRMNPMDLIDAIKEADLEAKEAKEAAEVSHKETVSKAAKKAAKDAADKEAAPAADKAESGSADSTNNT